jgi:peptidyl-prolyl cis-trans isomerase SurA
MARAALAWLLLASLPAGQLAAQATGPELVDRIVAVVGDRPILLSEIDEAINVARGQGLQVPEDSTQLHDLRRQFLEDLVNEEVVYQRSRRDTSITVTEAEVQSSVDEQYRRVRANFRSEPEFRTALQGAGMGTPEEYRRFLTDQSRRQAYAQKYIQKLRSDGKLRAGTISEAEMRAMFDQATRGGDLPRLPPTVTFRQIVVAPRPSEPARQRAIQLADSLRTAIERGADFATLARRFSDDEGSKPGGGDLGFFRRGIMTRPFEEVAFAIRPGVVSPVVRTEFGYHLILVDRIQPGEVKARHILIAPVITAVEAAAARARADTVATLLRAGAGMDSLTRVYGDSSEPRVIGPTNSDSLPPGYAQALSGATAGQIVGPAPMNPELPERTRFLVALVTSAQPARASSFEDVREQIRTRLIEQKGMTHLFEDLRRQAYVDVRF